MSEFAFFPLNLNELMGHWPSFIVYALIGFAFGYILEISGFGVSTKLAAQFYFKEMTVLKVMFGAIIVAMSLIFLASGLGLLDYNLIWVNPTYLWPGIVGGLIMGVGFILGGFCPGTSLVSAATGKIDGIFFVLGVFVGIFLFGETVGLYEDFYFSSYMGRFTIPELFNMDEGLVVLLIVVAALLAFVGSEFAEKYIGKINLATFGQWRFGAAVGMIVLALIVLFVGQPTNEDRWNVIASGAEAKLSERAIYAHPVEILQLMDDRKLVIYLIDVRSETDFNLFHIRGAHHIPFDTVLDAAPSLQFEPSNTVFVVMSNDEAQATAAWRILAAENVPNLYVLEGGINNWLSYFADEAFLANNALSNIADDTLAYRFDAALGDNYPAANPNPDVYAAIEFTPHVQLQVKRGATSGGCG